MPTYVNFRSSLSGSLSRKYDIVIAQRILGELDSKAAHIDLVEALWKRTNHFLILIESHQNEHFAALMNARNFLLTHGYRFDHKHAEEAINTMQHINGTELRALLNDKQASEYEKYHILKQVGASKNCFYLLFLYL